MTREGYKSIIVTSNAYRLARKQAEVEKESIAQIVGKAIERYVYTRKDLEERALFLLKLLDKERNQVSSM